MRIVLDTNILARAFASPTGPAGEALERIRSPHLLVVSLQILDELADVLGRPRVRQLHGRDDPAIFRFVQLIEAAALVVAVSEESAPCVVQNDRDDDLVIATAVGGNADVICTCDKDFRAQVVVSYCRQRSIEIVDDIELLQQLRSSTA